MRKEQKISNIIYQASNGAIEFKGDYNKETIWANQKQIAEIFGVDVKTINEHIGNIYKSKELSEKTTIRKFQIVQLEGNRNIKRRVLHYNLDMMISVGYRVNSAMATQFRIWATNILRSHILEGYTINKKLLQKNYNLFQKAISDIQSISQNKINSDDILELIKIFSHTWFSLDAFDKNIKQENQTQETVKINSENLYKDILKLKKELISKNEATDLFAKEKENNLNVGAHIVRARFE